MKLPKIEVLSQKTKFKDPWIEVVQYHYLYQKRDIHYTTIDQNDCVIIIPIDEEKNTLILEQYRFPIDKVCTSFPMGRIDSGETPNKAAQRELFEETGITSHKLQPIGTVFTTPGLSRQQAFVFIAHCSSLKEQPLDVIDREEEILSLSVTPFMGLKNKIKQQIINDNYTLSALMMAYLHLE